MTDLNALDKNGNTLLMIAAVKGDGEEVARLLNAGANPLVQDKHGMTARTRAVNRGYPEVAALLEKAEADTSVSELSSPNDKQSSSDDSQDAGRIKYTPPKDTKLQNNSVASSNDYKTSILVAKIVSAIGWFTCVAAIVIVISALAAAGKMGALAIAPVLGVLIGGLILVIAGQSSRAIMDNANYSRLMLEDMRKKA